MRTGARLVLMAVALMCGGCDGSGGAATQPAASRSHADAATQALATFQSLVTPQNYQGLGFASLDDVRKAQLGEPMTIYHVGLDALRRYQQGAKADDALTDAKRSFYPVTVDGRVVTSIFVAQHDDGYRATDFGKAAVARAVTTYRRDKDDFIVQVPVAKVYLFGRRSDGNVTVTPVADDPRFEFKAGESLPLERALLTMQRVLADYNGLPQ
jgi:hypothetical protein